ncbi:MAG: S9 family peptidase, partial [Rubrivivax sp.]|nr:S9 family peptidase [Rubrivivax sp.]
RHEQCAREAQLIHAHTSRRLTAALRCLSAALALCAGAVSASEPVTVAKRPLTVADFLAPYGVQQAAISPDGRHVALIEHRGRIHSLKLVRIEDLDQRVLLWGRWVEDGRYLVNKQPRRVSWVNNSILAVDMGAVAEALDLTGKKIADLGSRVIGKAVPGDPDSTLMLVHDDEDLDTVSAVDVQTRKSRRLRYPMSGTPKHWTFDEQGALRAVLLADSSIWRDDTTLRLWYLPGGQKDWMPLLEHRVTDDTWLPLAASAERDELLVASRHQRDKVAVFRYTPLKGDLAAAELMLADEHADVAPGENLRGQTAMSFYALGLKPQRQWLDRDWRTVQTAVDEVLPGRINDLSGNPAGQVLIHSYSDLDPGRWLLLDVPKAELRLLAMHRQRIDPAHMRPMETYHYASADGLQIPAFLTRPEGPAQPRPTVVLVHGGPAARDHWGWNAEVQLLASRGYVVFQPQFRGSTGFGKAFEVAGHGQWGLAMQDDITAGVQDLVRRGIADPRRICIYGASYGGYAAMWGLVKTPELYRCGVTLSGVSDIGYMLTDWSDSNGDKMTRELMRLTVGDRKRQQAQFDAVSPLKHAARIQAPVFIAHGEEDVRVPFSHASKLRSALDRAGKRYEWLALPHEGHSLFYLASQQRFYAQLLKFLDQNLLPAAAPTEAPAEAKP